MEMTGVVHLDAENGRKSLGRRVSFANHAHVRLFEVPEPNTNSTTSPQSSPGVETGDLVGMNDENAYPGAASFRRRTSIRRSPSLGESGGEESMDLDSEDIVCSAAFSRAKNIPWDGNEVDILDGDYDDMDMTEAIPHNTLRKRSLSFGVTRQPLASLSAPPALLDNQAQYEQEDSTEQSIAEDASLVSRPFGTEENTSQPMEFTVPLIRPPEPPSDAWLALRAATHSGDTPYIPSSDDEELGGVQEMELTDAVARLQAARESLGLDEGSFASTEDSFGEEHSGAEGIGNKTINVTQLMKRVSLAPATESATDASCVHDTPEPTPSPSVVPSVVSIESSGISQQPSNDATPPMPTEEVPENTTDQVHVDVQPSDFGAEEGPQISIEQFFEMTGIRFLDEITAPRRATAYLSSLGMPGRSSTDGQIPLAEYVVAMALDVPQLELYTHISKDLQAWIERIQGIFKTADDEVLNMPPQLFHEFVTADEAGQADLIHQLKLIKVHNHQQAKSEWYDWKMQWVEQLHQKAAEGFQDLEAV